MKVFTARRRQAFKRTIKDVTDVRQASRREKQSHLFGSYGMTNGGVH